MCAANFSKYLLPAEELSISDARAVEYVAGVGCARESHREEFGGYLQFFPNWIALEEVEHGMFIRLRRRVLTSRKNVYPELVHEIFPDTNVAWRQTVSILDKSVGELAGIVITARRHS